MADDGLDAARAPAIAPWIGALLPAGQAARGINGFVVPTRPMNIKGVCAEARCGSVALRFTGFSGFAGLAFVRRQRGGSSSTGRYHALPVRGRVDTDRLRAYQIFPEQSRRRGSREP